MFGSPVLLHSGFVMQRATDRKQFCIHNDVSTLHDWGEDPIVEAALLRCSGAAASVFGMLLRTNRSCSPDV